MARINDLREYLQALESIGDVEHIDRPVSAALEAAAITRRSTELRRPAPLFDIIEGAAPGFRMLGAAGALASDRDHPLARVALSLGLGHDATAPELVEHLVAAHGKTPIPPKLISADSAPCKQNILVGKDATLDRFPIPLVHQDDGGRYLNTWGVIVATTPDGRWTNWSISRIMTIDNRRMTGLFLPQQHIGMIWAEWVKGGKPRPFAVVQGGATHTWPVTSPGPPPDDSQIAPAVGVSAELVALLRNAGLPTTTAWLLVDTACHWMIITVPRNWRDVLPQTSTTEFVHRVGELMSTSRVGHMCPVTYVLDDDIDPSNISDVLWALGTRIHPNLRQEHWPVPILPWYQCYTEQERHTGQGPIVVHDGLLPPVGDGRARPATFDNLYPQGIRDRVLAAESSATPTAGR